MRQVTDFAAVEHTSCTGCGADIPVDLMAEYLGLDQECLTCLRGDVDDPQLRGEPPF